MTVFVEDKQEGAVKIVKRGSNYCVYPLKRVIYKNVPPENPLNPDDRVYTFEWEKKPKETWGYKPYEDHDVHNNEKDLDVGFIKTWQQHKVQASIP